MRTISTDTLIAAPVEKVWQVLANFSEHQHWDPFLTSIEGKPAVGERLTVKFRNGMTMRPTVTEVEPGKVLEWFGRLLFGGIFDGRHRFELEKRGEHTRLVHSERFSGVLVPLTGGLLAKTEEGFVAFNEALKARVEAAG